MRTNRLKDLVVHSSKPVQIQRITAIQWVAMVRREQFSPGTFWLEMHWLRAAETPRIPVVIRYMVTLPILE